VEDLRQNLKADLDKLIEINLARRSRDNDEAFTSAINALNRTHLSTIQQSSKNVSEQIHNNRLCDLILDSLHFQQLRDRELQIDTRAAYPETFAWIFKKGPDTDSQGSNFVRWITAEQASKNVFWVAGRPGSGKSTLMHFLSGAPETKQAIALWAQMPLLQASNFFWLAGTPLRKSLEGLLRTLLFDLLGQARSLISQIAPYRWRAYERGFSGIEPWSNMELTAALRDLVKATASIHRIFLLVDGLDEFEGSSVEQTELVNLLKSLADCDNVKACVSSRPWPIFASAFHDYPQFQLHELTRNDINLYVNGKFARVTEFEDLQAQNPEECSKLIGDVVEKAQGVFLWVYLVVFSLSQGIIDGDTFTELQKRLDEIPPDLEAYFRKIIDGIPKDYQVLASAYFSVMIAAHNEIVSTLSLSFLEFPMADLLQDTPAKPAAPKTIEARKRAMARRLESRCRGLLQVYRRGPGDDINLSNDESVTFLHRSVRDFLLAEEIQQVLQRYASDTFNPWMFLCESIVAQVKLAVPYDPAVWDLEKVYVSYAKKLELYFDGTPIDQKYFDLTDLLFELANGLVFKKARDRKRYGSPGSIVLRTINDRLLRYSAFKIKSSTFDANQFNLEHQRSDSQQRNHGNETYYHLLSREILARPSLSVESTAVVKALFDKGADPNFKNWRKETIWEM
jgi:energy-coupling factor transporter ATP-binding protein EcfA2